MAKNPFPTDPQLDPIAYCGVNCTLCAAFQRVRRRCPGCRSTRGGQPRHCTVCRFRTCSNRPDGARDCAGCTRFPCTPLKAFDKRYRARYHVSPIENLRQCQAMGAGPFLEQEHDRWRCPACSAVLCMHAAACPTCGQLRSWILPSDAPTTTF